MTTIFLFVFWNLNTCFIKFLNFHVALMHSLNQAGFISVYATNENTFCLVIKASVPFATEINRNKIVSHQHSQKWVNKRPNLRKYTSFFLTPHSHPHMTKHHHKATRKTGPPLTICNLSRAENVFSLTQYSLK